MKFSFPFLFQGSNGISPSRLSHIAELDLTDNLLSEWSEVFLLLKMFPGLEFLNLSNNMLNEPIGTDRADLAATALGMLKKPLQTRKLVLNGNRVDWRSVGTLLEKMPRLEQLYLCANDLGNPTKDVEREEGQDWEGFSHQELKQLYLSCNPLSDFDLLTRRVCARCPNLRLLSMAECPVDSVPPAEEAREMLGHLYSLNLSTTRVGSWEEVDKLRGLPSLKVEKVASNFRCCTSSELKYFCSNIFLLCFVFPPHFLRNSFFPTHSFRNSGCSTSPSLTATRRTSGECCWWRASLTCRSSTAGTSSRPTRGRTPRGPSSGSTWTRRRSLGKRNN